MFRRFRAVAVGNSEWGVPACDGGLFSADPAVSQAGAALAKISIPDAAFEPALDHLLLIDTPDGPLGPVDFRALGVREFGTIYEGLLESELPVADIDLALDARSNYVPRRAPQLIAVPAGAVYLHNRSGVRKSTGSYFTKSFAVEHLLDRALEPALDDHLKRIGELDETDAAEVLFDFRIADIAMGSGHFLVAAIDRIERRIADYLSGRPLAGVRGELADLRGAAEKELGADGGYPAFANLGAFEAGHNVPAARFTAPEVLSWNDSAFLPLLPTERSVEIFARLRRSPRLDLNDGTSWRARPDTELHATAQKPLMDLDSKTCPTGFWPIFKGESFDIWTPNAGEYYAFADPDVAIEWIYRKRLRSGRTRRDSAHAEFPAAFRQDKRTLACHCPRIAFRDVSRATDSRTVRACLLPPKIFLTNKVPYLLWPRGDERDHAFLLGILCSIPLDWYARRFVEVNLNFFIFNPFPIPRPPRSDPLWRRVVTLAGRLAAPDDRFAEWAEAACVAHGKLPEDEKQDMIAELDAIAARLYGLDERQIAHVFETFHEGWDYDARLRAVLAHFRAHARTAAA